MIQEPAQQLRIFCVLEEIHLLAEGEPRVRALQVSDKVLKRFLSIFSALVLGF
jgi:hypothetical protein